AALADWLGEREANPAQAMPLASRMLRDFGLPFAFTGVLSLLACIALYRALAVHLTLQEDFNAVLALVTSFAMLALAVGGVIVRAAREIATPLEDVAAAAEAVARGDLEAPLPDVRGPREVARLAESVER